MWFSSTENTAKEEGGDKKQRRASTKITKGISHTHSGIDAERRRESEAEFWRLVG